MAKFEVDGKMLNFPFLRTFLNLSTFIRAYECNLTSLFIQPIVISVCIACNHGRRDQVVIASGGFRCFLLLNAKH